MASTEIVSEEKLQPLLDNPKFDQALFLRKYSEWKAAKANGDQNAGGLFSELRTMHENGGYHNQVSWKIWQSDQEMDEIAAIVQKYQDGKIKIAASTTTATAQVAASNPAGAPVVEQANGANGIKEVKETLNIINPETLEKAITVSEKLIALAPQEMQYTLRGVYGATIIQTLRQAGHNLVIKNNQIEIVPKAGVSTVDLSEKLQTLVNTGKLPIDSLKVGLLYGSKTFEDYSNLKKVKDAAGKESIDPKASMNDFLMYVQERKKAGDPDQDINAIIDSRSMLSGVNFQQAIKGFQDLGQVSVMLNNPAFVNAVSANNPQSTAVPAGTPQSSGAESGPIQNGANAVAGKGGEFAGEVAGNIGGFAKGVSQALGEGFKQGGAIGGLAVAIISIMGAWKFLTGEWGTKNHKLSGWMIALGGFGGKAGYDMMKKYGLVDKAEEVADRAGKKLKGTVGGESDGGSSDDADAKPDKTSEKPAASIETKDLSASQKLAVQRVEGDENLKKTFEKATPGQVEYLNFIHANIAEIPLGKLVTDDDSSIFSPGGKLDASIATKLGNLVPNTLKKVLRVYLRSSARFEETKEGTSPGNKEKMALLVELEKHGIKKEKMTNTSFKDAIGALYSTSTTETNNTSAEIMKKIGDYQIVYDGKPISKENIDVKVGEYEQGGYQIKITIKDPKKLNPNADKIDPIIVDFDKNGKLETKKITITGCAILLGQEVPGDPQSCVLKQVGSSIEVIKVSEV